jgi:nucleoid DNA-binding protein
METQMSKPLTKNQLIAEIADKQGISKSTVKGVLSDLAEMARKQLVSDAATFTIPGIVKLWAVKKPAQPARPGINPFTRQQITVAAKPASNKVKSSAVKALRAAVQ